MPEQSGSHWPRFLSALRHRNFRYFWFGQCISLTGTWMQNIALSWLVLDLTKSAFLLGLINAIQFTPLMLFSMVGGVIADRFSKRKLLLLTQSGLAIMALLLALDTTLGTVRFWHLAIISATIGMLVAIDLPTRQSFLFYLAGKEDLPNAIALNSAIFNSARLIGPAIAGLILANWGSAVCFWINALSFLPVIGGMLLITNPGRAIPSATSTGMWSELREGLQFIWHNPIPRKVILLVAITSTLALNYAVLVPILARVDYRSGAETFGLFMSATGLGAAAAIFFLAWRSHRGPSWKLITAGIFGLCLFEILQWPVRNYYWALIMLALTGMSGVTLSTSANSLLQRVTPDELRGRAMGVYAMVFGGLTPIGSLISGALAHFWGARLTFALLGATALVLSLLVLGLSRSSITKETTQKN